MNRALLASLTVVGMCAIVVYAGPNDLKDEGVGTYSDSSVVNQVSNFTINRQMISCGVGTVSGGGIGFSGPFAMLMYARDITHYDADHLTKIITARGRMRSITHFAGVKKEDTEHDFLAIAEDHGPLGDRFEIHFRTCFWNSGPGVAGPDGCLLSPCEASTKVPGGCRFGGKLLTDDSGMNQMGDITVGP